MLNVEPNLELKRYPLGTGNGTGWIVVTPQAVSITVTGRREEDAPIPPGHDYMAEPDEVVVLDPSLAPLFRMVANRLDELSGKRGRRRRA